MILCSHCYPPPSYLREQIVEIALYLKGKHLLHRDISGSNLVVGNLEGKDSQLFLIDCAYMTFLDDEGKIIPTPIENCARLHARSQDAQDRAFAGILAKLDAKLVAENQK